MTIPIELFLSALSLSVIIPHLQEFGLCYLKVATAGNRYSYIVNENVKWYNSVAGEFGSM